MPSSTMACHETFRSNLLSLPSNRPNVSMHNTERSVLFSLLSVCSFFATMHYFVVYHYSGDPAAPLFIYGAYAADSPFQYTSSVTATNSYEYDVQTGKLNVDVVLTSLTADSYSWRNNSNIPKSADGRWYAVAPLFQSTPPIGDPTCYYINMAKITCTFTPKADFDISADIPVTVIINGTSLSGPSVYCPETSDYFNKETVKNKGQYLFFGWPQKYESASIPIGTDIVGSVTHDQITYSAKLNRKLCNMNLFAADSTTIKWKDSPPGLLSANLDAKGVHEVLHYPVQPVRGPCTYDIYFQAHYANGAKVIDRKLEYLVFDGEGTNKDEYISVTTDGSEFIMIELFGSGTVESTGNGTKSITFKNTEKHNTFPVFSSSGIDVHFEVVSYGSQGSAFAVRVFCDYSGQGTPNYLNSDYIISENKDIGKFTITNVVTPTPSESPTLSTTITKSTSGSLSGSLSLSLSPTASPSTTPSESPTLSETITKSTSGSLSGSLSLSLSPTASPSTTPSESPTLSKTITKSTSGSLSGSLSLSLSPTASPSTTPSESPTLSTTITKSTSGSLSGSLSLSLSPTASPSTTPSESPTLSTTITKSTSGSLSGSLSLSLGPTASPSTTPSESPTLLKVMAKVVQVPRTRTVSLLTVPFIVYLSVESNQEFAFRDGQMSVVLTMANETADQYQWRAIGDIISGPPVIVSGAESIDVGGQTSRSRRRKPISSRLTRCVPPIFSSISPEVLPFVKEPECFLLNKTSIECFFGVKSTFYIREDRTVEVNVSHSQVVSPVYWEGRLTNISVGNFTIFDELLVSEPISTLYNVIVVAIWINTLLVFIGGPWIEVQCIVLAMRDLCSPFPDQQATRYAMYLIAPFYEMGGYAWGIIGNVLLVLLVTVLHMIFLVMRNRFSVRQKNTVITAFPSILFSAGIWAYVGIVYCTFCIFFILSRPSQEANPNYTSITSEIARGDFDTGAVMGVSLALGLIVIIALPVAMAVIRVWQVGRLKRWFYYHTTTKQVVTERLGGKSIDGAGRLMLKGSPSYDVKYERCVGFFDDRTLEERAVALQKGDLPEENSENELDGDHTDIEAQRHGSVNTQERVLRRLYDECNESVNSAGAHGKVPRVIGFMERLFLPIGFWGYRYAEMNFEFGQYPVGWRQLCAGYPFLLSIPIAIMCAVSADHPRRPKGPFPPEGRCMVTSGMVLGWFLVMAILVAVLRPYRILFSSIMTSTALVFCTLVCLLMILDVTFAMHLVPLMLLFISVLMRTCHFVYVWWWERSQHDPIWRLRFSSVDQSRSPQEYIDSAPNEADVAEQQETPTTSNTECNQLQGRISRSQCMCVTGVDEEGQDVKESATSIPVTDLSIDVGRPSSSSLDTQTSSLRVVKHAETPLDCSVVSFDEERENIMVGSYLVLNKKRVCKSIHKPVNRNVDPKCEYIVKDQTHSSPLFIVDDLVDNERGEVVRESPYPSVSGIWAQESQGEAHKLTRRMDSDRNVATVWARIHTHIEADTVPLYNIDMCQEL